MSATSDSPSMVAGNQTAAALLSVRDLKAGYGPVKVLHGVSFEVGAGEVVVILGANGAGKTTTLRAISHLIDYRGEITFDGAALRGCRPEKVVARGIAHVPQGRGTVNSLTVEENLQLGAIVRRDRAIASDIQRWYEVFPRLGDRRKQPAGKMSGGEQQMLAIARALMSRPRLLLLDEPSLGLAPKVTQELFEVLASIQQAEGMGMLVVEQNAALALDLASRAYVLEAGTVAVSGSAEELRDDDSIRRSYLGY